MEICRYGPRARRALIPLFRLEPRESAPSTSTFSLKDPQNTLLGTLNRFGVYLTENGSAGAIQQLDLVV
ncbi:MAG: hypothetical protein AB1507_05780 [Bacillota bacterium]|jgi:hypothetical protein